MPTQESSNYARVPQYLLILYPKTTAAPPLAADPHTKKKPKRDSNAQPPDTPPPTQTPRPSHDHDPLAPTVNTTGANGNSRADIADVSAQTEQQDWRHLIDRILQELRETLSSDGSKLKSAAETFLCELLSALLLRSYRAYSLEKMFGHGNSGPQGAVKDAIEQDKLEMSFEKVTAFALQNGYRRIENVRGNRASDSLTGDQFFDWIWGDRPISRKHWDTADFRQQYRRICSELHGIHGEVGSMRVKFERTMKYRFFQSQTIFCYPDINNGVFASVGKSVNGEGPTRKVWYHQPETSFALAGDRLERDFQNELKEVKRCNGNPAQDGEEWKPKRLPKNIQLITSWELVKKCCRMHPRLRFAI